MSKRVEICCVETRKVIGSVRGLPFWIRGKKMDFSGSTKHSGVLTTSVTFSTSVLCLLPRPLGRREILIFFIQSRCVGNVREIQNAAMNVGKFGFAFGEIQTVEDRAPSSQTGRRRQCPIRQNCCDRCPAASYVCILSTRGLTELHTAADKIQLYRRQFALIQGQSRAQVQHAI